MGLIPFGVIRNGGRIIRGGSYIITVIAKPYGGLTVNRTPH